MEIKDLVTQLSNTPFDPTLSLTIAKEYERIGQTASAVSFYLRTAEYGYYTHYDYVYASLLRSAICFEKQKNRQNTVLNLLLKAVAYSPSRPEGWFLLSRYYERNGNWQDCYTYAEVGLSTAKTKLNPLPVEVDYPGEYGLVFEKAVSGWWVGRKDEAISLFKDLLQKENISKDYRSIVTLNLNRIDDSTEYINPLEVVVTSYRKFFGAKAPLIMDVGTRDGDDAFYLYKHLNGEKVTAIDANPICAKNTARKYPWMNVMCTAVSDKEGTTTFYRVQSDDKEVMGTSSLISKETSVVVSPEFYRGITTPEKVPVTRMDKLLEEGVIDIVKIDVEGYTWQVLQGFGGRLKDVKLFHLETEIDKLSKEHVTTDHVTKFMIDHGFYLADVSYEWGNYIQDQVWVNTELAISNKDVFTSLPVKNQ